MAHATKKIGLIGLGRVGEALARRLIDAGYEAVGYDVDAALDRNPSLSASLYLRAAIERKLGKAESADRDAASARLISPRIAEEYARWKIKA